VNQALLQGIRDALENPFSTFRNLARQSTGVNEQRADAARQRLDTRIADRRAEIGQVEEHIRELLGRQRNTEDEVLKKSLAARVKINRNKLRRLRLQLARWQSDRNMIDLGPVRESVSMSLPPLLPRAARIAGDKAG
jgi:hypothetical protein